MTESPSRVSQAQLEELGLETARRSGGITKHNTKQKEHSRNCFAAVLFVLPWIQEITPHRKKHLLHKNRLRCILLLNRPHIRPYLPRQEC